MCVRPQSSCGWGDVQEVASLPDQTEAAKKDATTEGLGASEVAELKSIISTLNEKLMTLQVDLDDRGEEVRRLEAVLQQSQALLAEKDAEIAILKVQAAAAFSGRVTPTTNLHIPSATSITGSTRYWHPHRILGYCRGIGIVSSFYIVLWSCKLVDGSSHLIPMEVCAFSCRRVVSSCAFV